MTNIFDTLDKQKLSTSLYPQETVELLTDLLNLIWESFDPYKKFNEQFYWKTKGQYEDMMMYILQKFSDIESLREEDWSVKFILSKVLESIIFKNLETIYFYNLYNDPEKRLIRTQLERALDHIYQCNLLSENYILDNEISKVVVEGVVITDPVEIKKALSTTMKKTRYVYSIKLNEEFNTKSDEQIRAVYENLESLNLEKPTLETLKLKDLQFTTPENFWIVYSKNKDKLTSLLLDEKSYYLTKKWVLRANSKNKKLIIDIDFSKLSLSNWRLVDTSLDLSISLNPKLWGYYLSLIQTGFIRTVNAEEIIKRESILKWNISLYSSLLTNIPESITALTKYGETIDRVEIKSIEIKWRIYKESSEIYEQLLSLWASDVFKATFSDNCTLIVSKDLNYFYLLNLGLIDKIFLSDKELSLEQVDQLALLPRLENGRSFQIFINTFLDYELEDYLNEYDDTRILEIISKNFSKNDIIKYTREYKLRIDKLEETLNIAKLLPKSLHE